MAIIDSGSTGNFLHIDSPCENIIPTTNGIRVKMPNGTSIISTHTADLALPGLPKAARKAHLFPDLKSGPLISISAMCDHGCTATFEKTKVSIHNQRILVLEGHRNHDNGLWYVQLPSPHQICNTVYHVQTQVALAKFLHGACFSPTISTFLEAIKAGYLRTWPGLTVQLVNKWLPKSMATAKGHLDQQWKNL